MASSVEILLQNAGLFGFTENFRKQHINTTETCKCLSDQELSSLGLTTIGDRARFRLHLQQLELQSSQPEAPAFQGNVAVTAREFQPSRSRQSTRGRKPSRRKTWTATFMCLSDTNQKTVPTHAEKICLQKAGIGIKKITFDALDSELEVHATLTGAGAFPKLAGIGGFELMYCAANRRCLEKIDVKWDVEHLKTVIGGQSRIYIRPIQNCLPLEDDEEEEYAQCSLTYPCKKCGNKISVNDLREHIGLCMQNETYSSEVSIDKSKENGINTSDIHTEETKQNETNISEIINNDILPNPYLLHIPFDLNSADNNSGQFHYIISGTDLGTGGDTSQEPTTQTVTDNIHVSLTGELPSEIQQVTEDCIKDIISFDITDPIHCLKYIQSKIVTGRKLDLEEDDLAAGLTGDTSFIIVDRRNILTTGMEEISGLENLQLTLEVQFYGENAEDVGGPRKEFFSIILPEIRRKYFEPVRDWVDMKEYETAGKICALSMLQNGKLPRILDADALEELFGESPRGVLSAFGKGMDSLGLFQLLKAHPFLRHLITPVVDPPVTLKTITHLLKPDFSPDGSNKRAVESTIYQKFIKYLRQVAGRDTCTRNADVVILALLYGYITAGRREGINLGMVLQFVTGIDAVPPLGFGISPSVTFTENVSLLPTANTCSNRLALPVPGDTSNLPDVDSLFTLYDYAFSNTYFGMA